MGLVQEELARDREARWFNIAGTFFLAVQIIILSALLFDPETRVFLMWSCNNFALFLAIACYLKNMQLVKGISYLGLLTQILWGADFVSPFFGFNVSSISDYVTTGGFTYVNNVSIGLHMLVPLAVLALSFRARPEARSLFYSLPYIAFLFVATITLTPAAQDINCVFSGCKLDAYLPFDIRYHSWLWPVYAMISAFLGYIIHHALYYGWNKASTMKVLR